MKDSATRSRGFGINVLILLLTQTKITRCWVDSRVNWLLRLVYWYVWSIIDRGFVKIICKDAKFPKLNTIGTYDAPKLIVPSKIKMNSRLSYVCTYILHISMYIHYMCKLVYITCTLYRVGQHNREKSANMLRMSWIEKYSGKQHYNTFASLRHQFSTTH